MSISCQYSLVEKNKKIVEKGFEREEGRFVKGLDTALSTFQVQRQAYYGGTFVGNHVHRCLKVCITYLVDISHYLMFITIQENNILTLCNSVVETATRNDITLVDEAEQIRDKYHKLFKLFADCHNIYNSTFLIDSEINDLGKILLHQYHSYIVMMPTIPYRE